MLAEFCWLVLVVDVVSDLVVGEFCVLFWIVVSVVGLRLSVEFW